MSLKSILRLLLGSLGLFFISYLIWQQREALGHQIAQHWLLWLLASLMITGGNYLLGISFARLVQRYDPQVPFKTGLFIFLISQITKYIPGRIWPFLLQASYMNKTKTVFVVNLDFFILFSSYTVFFGGAVLLASLHQWLYALIAILLGLIAITIIMYEKHWLILQYIFSKLSLHSGLRIQYAPYLYFFTGSLIKETALFMLIYVSLTQDAVLSLQIISINLISWFLAALAFFFPVGVGIKEGLFILIAAYIGTDLSELAALAAIITRLISIIMDLCTGLLAFLYLPSKQNQLK